MAGTTSGAKREFPAPPYVASMQRIYDRMFSTDLNLSAIGPAAAPC